MKHLRCSSLLGGLLVGALFCPGILWAGARLTDLQNSCTTLNCNSLTITSTYGHDQFSNADPAVFQVFTAGNECVRIAVTSQGTDLEATLTCPSGATWQDDDGNGSLRPLIKAITPAARGWCTLTFSHFTGEGAANDFTFTYGRYPANNINCASATPPIRLLAPAAMGEDEADKPLDGGEDRPPRRGGSVE